MIIAVTGATGFVGRHVMQQFIQAGRNVRALARDPAKLPVAASVTPVQGDLNDRNALAELCKGASAVLHIAGAISGSATDMLRVNAEGTAALLNAADRAGVRRVVHVSSLAAREPDLSPYGLSKARGEQAVHAASRSLQTLIIRPPAVYGEGDAATLPLLKALLARTAILPGLATAHFSLIHGEDLARILVAAVDDTVEGLREVDDGHGAYTWAASGRSHARAERKTTTPALCAEVCRPAARPWCRRRVCHHAQARHDLGRQDARTLSPRLGGACPGVATRPCHSTGCRTASHP